MTILVLSHEPGYKNLKAFYLEEIVRHHSQEFPALVSYQRFVQLQSGCVSRCFSISLFGDPVGNFAVSYQTQSLPSFFLLPMLATQIFPS